MGLGYLFPNLFCAELTEISILTKLKYIIVYAVKFVTGCEEEDIVEMVREIF